MLVCCHPRFICFRDCSLRDFAFVRSLAMGPVVTFDCVVFSSAFVIGLFRV